MHFQALGASEHDDRGQGNRSSVTKVILRYPSKRDLSHQLAPQAA